MTPTKYINPIFEDILSNPYVAPQHSSLLGIATDLVVPSFPGKSSKQLGIDLVQPLLNKLLKLWLVMTDWQAETAVGELADGCDEDKGRLDFTRKLPNGKYLAIEVQFGNSSYIERDLGKIQMLHNQGLLEMGYYVVMTRDTANTSDTGQATFEAAVRRIKTSHPNLPVYVLGLSRENSEVADLSKVRDIVYPPVLGGSGTGTEELHLFLAEAILNRVDLSTLELPSHLREIVWTHAREHTKKTVQAFQTELDRALNCQNQELREELLAILAETVKHSLASPSLSTTASIKKPRELGCSTSKPSRTKQLSAQPSTSSIAEPSQEALPAPVCALAAFPTGKAVRVAKLVAPEPEREPASAAKVAPVCEQPTVQLRRRTVVQPVRTETPAQRERQLVRTQGQAAKVTKKNQTHQSRPPERPAQRMQRPNTPTRPAPTTALGQKLAAAFGRG